MSLHWSEAAALVKNAIIQSSFVTRSINFEIVYWTMVKNFRFELEMVNEVIKIFLDLNDTWD